MVEDIVLESPQQATTHLTPPDDAVRKVVSEYSVKPKFSAHKYHYRLVNDRFLEIEKLDKKGSLTAKTSFHVGLLEAKPQKTKSTAWIVFIGALLTAVAAGVMAFKINDWMLAASTGAFSLLLFVVHYFSYKEFSSFYSRSGKAPLITFNHRCSSKKSLQDFIKKLQQSIQQNTLPASSQYFAEETKWHRTLKDQGWISAEDYEKARSRIMKQFNRKTS